MRRAILRAAAAVCLALLLAPAGAAHLRGMQGAAVDPPTAGQTARLCAACADKAPLSPTPGPQCPQAPFLRLLARRHGRRDLTRAPRPPWAPLAQRRALCV